MTAAPPRRRRLRPGSRAELRRRFGVWLSGAGGAPPRRARGARSATSAAAIGVVRPRPAVSDFRKLCCVEPRADRQPAASGPRGSRAIEGPRQERSPVECARGRALPLGARATRDSRMLLGRRRRRRAAWRSSTSELARQALPGARRRFGSGRARPRRWTTTSAYYDPRDLWPMLGRAGCQAERHPAPPPQVGLNTFAVCRVPAWAAGRR